MSDRSSPQLHRSHRWCAMYDRHAPWLKARLRRRYGADEAEELCQETWLRLGPYDGLASIQHPKAFLLKIAARLAADRFGQSAKHHKLADALAEMGWWSVTLPAQTDEVLAKQLVLSLPQPLRDVFVLSRIGGLSNSQIGERLGISPKTVEWRMTRALAHCAAQLRR